MLLCPGIKGIPTIISSNPIESNAILIVYADMMTLYFTVFLLSVVCEGTGKEHWEFFNQRISGIA